MTCRSHIRCSTASLALLSSVQSPYLQEDNYAQIASIGPVGGKGLSACSSVRVIGRQFHATTCAANAPLVSFMENGTLFTVTDKEQIINTGGWDFVNNTAFGEDGNESINWNVIGCEANRRRTGVPEPSPLLLLGSGLMGLGGFARRRFLR
jgi:hypothetical protein